VPEASRKAAPSIADFNITDRMMNLHDRDSGFGIRDPDSGLESGLEIRMSIDGDVKRDKEDVKGGLIARQDR